MITINDLNIQFGDKYLFKQVSARINPDERIGLVGVNGAGKSTFLKIVAGQIETDNGVLVRAKTATVGYLPQETGAFPEGRTLYQEAESAFSELLAAQDELNDINLKLVTSDPTSPDCAILLNRQGELQNLVEHTDIFRIKSNIHKVLLGLGFNEADFERDCQVFSGGWIMRLLLAKLLLIRPAFLLLDEPTNHLDIESLTWLEEFLKTYDGALIIISHDRSFLDNVTTSTWELSLGKLTCYRGNYSKYVAEKEIRMEVQKAAYDNQQAHIQQTKRFVERFRAKSTKAKQAQSRLRQLEKMELIELEDTERQISFRFPPSIPCGRMAIEVEGLNKSFDNKTVFAGLSFHLERGDKLGVVGVNGAGKSTLVKTLAGLIRQDSGEIKPGHNVKISYFGQHQANDLSPELTVLQTMSTIGVEMSITQTRSILGAFLFSGDDVDKKVQVLSGGEKSRLALAKMIATPANLLIMDEPTNHLDMMSQEVLQQALKQYDGSIIVVSHNRYFVDGFVNKVLEIKNGKATLFDGNIAYYLEKIKNTHSETLAKEISVTAKPRLTDPASLEQKSNRKEQRQITAKLRIEKNRQLLPFRKTVTDSEKEIEQLEAQKISLESRMADPDLYKDETAFAECSRDYSSIKRRLERLYLRWEEAQSKIEEIETFLTNAL